MTPTPCPRLFVPPRLRAGVDLALPDGAARHVQVLRLQPGAPLVLFDGTGGQWRAIVEHMGRREVRVRLFAHEVVEREAGRAVTLALAMPANERMDDLIEKATELGVATVQPLVSERSVLRLAGERAARKQAHWQAVAASACEQCGRNRVPEVAPVRPLATWLVEATTPAPSLRLLLDPGTAAPLATLAGGGEAPCVVLSGPEGGLTDAERQAALDAGFVAATLGPRILRADTAPLAALALLTLATSPATLAR